MAKRRLARRELTGNLNRLARRQLSLRRICTLRRILSGAAGWVGKLDGKTASRHTRWQRTRLTYAADRRHPRRQLALPIESLLSRALKLGQSNRRKRRLPRCNPNLIGIARLQRAELSGHARGQSAVAGALQDCCVDIGRRAGSGRIASIRR